MGAKGITIAEECHVINILPPQSATTAVDADVFIMKNYAHATIICQFGTTNADAGNITVEECTAADATGATALSTTLWTYAETTATGDTLGARTNDVSIDVSANDNIFYVIEIDASELSAGYNYVQVAYSAPGGATLISMVAILSGSRYPKDQSPTALT